MVSLVIRAHTAVGLFADPEPVTDLEADWQARINGDGVVWYHDFETAAEVDQFRWTGGYGNDPDDDNPDTGIRNTVRWKSDDGITNGCLEIFRPAGSNDPSTWWRQFSALSAESNGRSTPDPADGGTIALKSFTPVADGGQTAGWDGGFYGNASYHAANPGDFDGTDYYIQCRVKVDPRRVTSGNPDGGKMFYFTRTDQSLTSQEIVTVSGWVVSGQTYFRMYRSGVGNTLVSVDQPGVTAAGHQPGSEYNEGVGDLLCRYDSTGQSDGRINNCWHWPLGEWVTVLYHVTNGTGTAGGGDDNTHIEVWIAEDGDTEYTKIWDQPTADLPFDVVPGHNALICSAYMNGQTFATDLYHRYCQIIFSKQFIACPQFYAPTTALSILIASLSAGAASTSLGSTWTGASLISGDDINWQNRFHYDPVRKRAFAAGKIQNVNTAMDFAFWDETTNVWASRNCGFNEGGHVWDCIAYSHKTGKGYLIPGGGRQGTLYQCEWNDGDPIISVASSSAAAQIGSFMTTGDAFVNGAAAMDIHPDFFGAGQEALLICMHEGLASWNPVTDVWAMVILWSGAMPAQHPRPVCVYSRGLGAVICSSGAANSPTTYHRVTNSTTNATITAPPIDLSVDDGVNAIGALIDDPSGLSGPYVFEKNGTDRVWQFNGSTWPIKSWTHPFTATDANGENFLIAPVYPYGGRHPAFWALERSSGTPQPRVLVPET